MITSVREYTLEVCLFDQRTLWFGVYSYMKQERVLRRFARPTSETIRCPRGVPTTTNPQKPVHTKCRTATFYLSECLAKYRPPPFRVAAPEMDVLGRL